MTIRVLTVPCLSDNYAYVVAVGDDAAVVDPSEAAPVERALASHGLRLREIWCTHHHLDHVGGNDALVTAHPGVRVRGSTYDRNHARIPCQTDAHGHDDVFTFAGHEVRVLFNPGHTLGAISFVVDGALFSGDTLFLGGCGRVFEGTMETMAASMRTLRSLPPATAVYCGHEYTAANLRFARSVEPGNAVIEAALEAAEAKGRAGEPTVPGTLAQELETNPFLRFDRAALAGDLAPDASFAALRTAKNSFRG